ncbi:MAG: AAA family ATPase, partial [Chloroflexi bacterium]|nr:AAA family ATPase [Chloroflexota bacterium]
MEKDSRKVPLDKLRWTCNPETFTFTCTDDLSSLEEFVGQERAIKAVEFGLSIDKPGYNLFVTGLTGTGKMSMIRAHLRRVLAERESRGQVTPIHDWCYVYNFSTPDRPLVITLPRGKGNLFRSQMEELRQYLLTEAGKVFSSKEYVEQRDLIVDTGQKQRQELLTDLNQQANQEGFLLHPTATGLMVIPMRAEGRPITQEEYTSLDNGTRQDLEAKQAHLMKRVEAAFERANALERETADQLRKLDRTVAEVALRHAFHELMEEYRGLPIVLSYLEGIQKFALDNLHLLRAKEGEEAQRPPLTAIPPEMMAPRDADPWLAF